MFDLKRLFGIGKSVPGTETARRAQAGLLDGDPIRLVAITDSLDDGLALKNIAQSFDWRLSVVDSSASAIDLLARRPAPLVIFDSDLAGEDWRTAVATLAAPPRAVCVLLASRVVDEYLFTEVVKHHGYDIVVKPFQRDELRRAVTFAWSWRGWTSRHDTLQKPTSL